MRSRRVVTAALWAVVAFLAAWCLVRVFGLERGTPFVQLVAATPYAAGGALAVLPLMAAMRRWPALAATTLTATVLLACVLPRGFADGGEPTAGPALRVMTVNMLKGTADAAAIVELVRAHRVDLLALQELTPEAENRLDAAGLAELLPNRSA